MRRTNTLTKRLDANWAQGTNAGGLFSGSKAASTWYHCFVIRKDSDGTIDAGFDTSFTAANKPAGWGNYRRVGSIQTDGSSNISGFVQFGDEFRWKSPPLDVDVTTQGSSAVSRTLSVPPGLKVWAIMNVFVSDANENNVLFYFRSPDANDEAPATGGAPLLTIKMAPATGVAQGELSVRTNTSGQIATRGDGGNSTARIATLGWRELRGKDQ